MGDLKTSISNVRRLLLKPKEGAPGIDLILGNLIQEFQNFYNELNNSSQPWTYKEFTITPSQNDSLITYEVGKIMFVRTDHPRFSVPVEFTDLRDASTTWWYYEGTASRPEDNGYWMGLDKLAFYRKDGQLYARNSWRYSNPLIVTAMTATLDPDLASIPVLNEYSHLPEIRAAQNLAGACEWDDGKDKTPFLMQRLPVQERQVYDQFVLAKRSMTQDYISYRGSRDYEVF